LKRYSALAALSALLVFRASAVTYGEFWYKHSPRFSTALHVGGMGGNMHVEAFSMGMYGNVYGVCGSLSYGFFDDFDSAYPFCRHHMRKSPILSEWLVGYSFPVWSNFDSQHRNGYTLHLAPMYGRYRKEYAYTMRDVFSFYPDHIAQKHSFGAIATLEFYNGTILNLRATQWGGEFGVGYSFFSPYRRRRHRK